MVTQGEQIQAVDLFLIRPFHDHPFHVNDDAEMEVLKDSIRESGLLTPAIVRPKGDGTYEMISGHRRMAACKALGLYYLRFSSILARSAIATL